MEAAMATRDDREGRALVLGMGRTGLSAIAWLRGLGYEVSAADSRTEPPGLAELRGRWPEVEVHRGGFGAIDPGRYGLVVVSPGVDFQHPLVRSAAAGGADVVGDVELFARAARRPIVAVTGSNGKSTVTCLSGAMLEAAGADPMVGGNIGVPVLDLLLARPPGCYVLELSSFQLEATESLAPVAACVLNLSMDHMDRHGDMRAYGEAKARILRHARVGVLNRADLNVLAMAAGAGGECVTFGLDEPPTGGDYGLRHIEGVDWLVRGYHRLLPLSEIRLAGRHNVANVLACCALVEAAGCEIDDTVRAAIRAWRGLPHRMEAVAECDGVAWINDSKGTNVGATVAAIEGLARPLVLIAGGQGKGADFAPLRDAAAGRVRAVVVLGEDGGRIAEALAGVVPVESATDLDQAVDRAAALARRGDTVLFSPACASFDMFRNFEHRGDCFRQAVLEYCQ
jgi:UDP-N-acetylmuramoylalanine--D-glutamate ligase